MLKEWIVTVFEIPEAVDGDPYIRVPSTADKDPSTMRLDRETGEPITLWEEKLRYPYKTKVDSTLHVITSKRRYEFHLVLDKDRTFMWNGQNILSIFWTLLGISRHSPEGLQASKWHDSLVEYKKHYLDLIRVDYPEIKVCEYRRLTSLIFRQLLMNMGVPKWKAYGMAWFVDQWQKIQFWKQKIK